MFLTLEDWVHSERDVNSASPYGPQLVWDLKDTLNQTVASYLC